MATVRFDDSIPQPTQDELLRLWVKDQERRKKKAEYLKTEEGKAYNCAKAKKYYEAHKDTVSQKRRAYYEKNKDRMLAYQREYLAKRKAESKKEVREGQLSVLESLSNVE